MTTYDVDETDTRPIRGAGWAFQLFRFRFPLNPSERQVGRRCGGSILVLLLSCLALVAAVLARPAPLLAEPGPETGGHHHHALETSLLPVWEGSTQGIAYSEFNHHLAGAFVLLIALSELGPAFGLSVFHWTRFLLPAAMLAAAMLLLIWSDHEAWPIGTLSFLQTFSVHDSEILQHKMYGVLSLVVGSVELLRRLGRFDHGGWAVPLPLFAIVGGLMLFGHMHGDHPAAYKIQIHHTVMGILAITAGSSKFVSGWHNSWRRSDRKSDGAGLSILTWETVWAGLILLIGIQLSFYSE